jgi:hypothetical protein
VGLDSVVSVLIGVVLSFFCDLCPKHNRVLSGFCIQSPKRIRTNRSTRKGPFRRTCHKLNHPLLPLVRDKCGYKIDPELLDNENFMPGSI